MCACEPYDRKQSPNGEKTVGYVECNTTLVNLWEPVQVLACLVPDRTNPSESASVFVCSIQLLDKYCTRWNNRIRALGLIS